MEIEIVDCQLSIVDCRFNKTVLNARARPEPHLLQERGQGVRSVNCQLSIVDCRFNKTVLNARARPEPHLLQERGQGVRSVDWAIGRLGDCRF
ncbi:MAG: hypothetical protein KAT48_13040 [Bacteroidales bacterium]|nr:hypothetical protein [Bacteroidales bacterium]